MSDHPDPLAAWEAEARQLYWERSWSALHTGAGPAGQWFEGALFNTAANCLDRHLPTRRDQPAIHWEGEPGDCRTLTYGELHQQVGALAAGLARLGVGAGERVVLHTGLLPECVVAMLACARLGAMFTVLPFSLPTEALADRLERIRPRVLFTQDGAWRHGTVLPLKARADEAQSAYDGIVATVVIRRTGLDVEFFEGDCWFSDLLEVEPRSRWPEPPGFPADHPLVGLQVASPTGSTKLVVHGAARLLLHAAAFHRSLTMADDDVLWVAAEVAWVAAPVHGIFGPLAAGATTVLYEGMLDTPSPARAWEIIDRYRVGSLLTTPSVARCLRQWAAEGHAASRVPSLRMVSTAGARVADDDRDWLGVGLGDNVSLVANIWGQTELCAATVVEPSPPGRAPIDLGRALLGPDGRPVPDGEVGELVVTNPWPGLFVAVESDDPSDPYWKHAPAYATGDLARREPDGTITIVGRTDDLVKVSGQFVSLTEIAQGLRAHPLVADAEVVHLESADHASILAAVALTADGSPNDQCRKELVEHLADTIGGLARPDLLVFVDAFPPDLSAVRRREALLRLGPKLDPGAPALTIADLRAAAAAS